MCEAAKSLREDRPQIISDVAESSGAAAACVSTHGLRRESGWETVGWVDGGSRMENGELEAERWRIRDESWWVENEGWVDGWGMNETCVA